MPAAVAEKITAETVAPPRSPRRLKPGNLSLRRAENAFNTWFCKAGPGDTADVIRAGAYFAHHARLLSRHDIIRVILDDESQEIELCVEKVLMDEVHTSVRKVYAREPLSMVTVPVGDTGEFRCEYIGGRGFCVVRNSDDHPVITGAANASTAIAEWHRTQPMRVVS